MLHSIHLSRAAAFCGGSSSLELLARKLARFGEAQALLALLQLPIPMSARVWWTLYGTTLSVQMQTREAAA